MKKNISKLFFVEKRTFILCKHFFHHSETCQHISLIIAFKRKNACILVLKSVEIYIAVMGEIDLPLITLWYLSFNIWKKLHTCQHYIHVCSFYTQKAKLTSLLKNLFKMNVRPQIKLFYSAFADLIVILRRVHLYRIKPWFQLKNNCSV